VGRENGWRGYWRGFVPCFLRAFPANAMALVAFEGVMRMLWLSWCHEDASVGINMAEADKNSVLGMKDMARLKKSSKQWKLLELGVRDPLPTSNLV
jgi:hypothetical protein